MTPEELDELENDIDETMELHSTCWDLIAEVRRLQSELATAKEALAMSDTSWASPDPIKCDFSTKDLDKFWIAKKPRGTEGD